MSLDPTSVAAKWHLNPLNGLTVCTSVTDDRQTDHATEQCIAIGGTACARAIPEQISIKQFLEWCPAVNDGQMLAVMVVMERLGARD